MENQQMDKLVEAIEGIDINLDIQPLADALHGAPIELFQIGKGLYEIAHALNRIATAMENRNES
jgi:hypothetical protein